ncbi:MAG: hypothetical protein NTW28_07965 [Candidatus Solibacter sp.]|nr:hypothetical protein [Candidatus Solibacter sp.]
MITLGFRGTPEFGDSVYRFSGCSGSLSDVAHWQVVTGPRPLGSGRRDPFLQFGLAPAFGDGIKGNILRQFCFILMFAGLAPGVLFGAGPDSPQRTTSVVRPDLRTGRLVRSMVISPRPVAKVIVAETVVPLHMVGADSVRH